MDQIEFLSLERVLELHAYQVEQFGGDPGVLNPGLLESALAQPGVSFGGNYLHEDLAAMAAAYLFHICKNHPFADGNKRTATHAAIAFLELNGYELEVPVDEAERLVLGVAEGKSGKEEVAAFFRRLMEG
jgi:death-on-curing protein